MAGPAGNLHVVVLAAGASTRLGQPKQLVRLGGRPVLHRVVGEAVAVAGASVTVVLGAHARDLTRLLQNSPASVVVNRHWEEGIASSLRCGLAAAPASADAVLVLPAVPGRARGVGGVVPLQRAGVEPDVGRRRGRGRGLEEEHGAAPRRRGGRRAGRADGGAARVAVVRLGAAELERQVALPGEVDAAADDIGVARGGAMADVGRRGRPGARRVDERLDAGQRVRAVGPARAGGPVDVRVGVARVEAGARRGREGALARVAGDGTRRHALDPEVVGRARRQPGDELAVEAEVRGLQRRCRGVWRAGVGVVLDLPLRARRHAPADGDAGRRVERDHGGREDGRRGGGRRGAPDQLVRRHPPTTP